MIKYCPFMSYHTTGDHEIYCFEKECGLWDENKGQCCLKTFCAAAGKPLGESGISKQAEYIYSVSPAPAVIPGSSGDWINPKPYTIVCQEDEKKNYFVNFNEGEYCE